MPKESIVVLILSSPMITSAIFAAVMGYISLKTNIFSVLVSSIVLGVMAIIISKNAGCGFLTAMFSFCENYDYVSHYMRLTRLTDMALYQSILLTGLAALPFTFYSEFRKKKPPTRKPE